MSKKPKHLDTLADFDPVSTALRLGLNEKPIASLNSLDDLLNSEEYLVEMVQLVADGASTSTIDLHLGLQPGMVDRWLRLGHRDSEGPFRVFYLLYVKAASVARSGAERALLEKSPEKWLDRIDILGQLSREPEALPEANSPQVLEGPLKDDSNLGLTFLNITPTSQEDNDDTSEG